MSKLWQLLNRELSICSTISIILTAIILYWMFNRYALQFYAVLFALLTASVGMLIYLLFSWQYLNKNKRWRVLSSIVAWLAIAYTVVHTNGLTITSLFWWQG